MLTRLLSPSAARSMYAIKPVRTIKRFRRGASLKFPLSHVGEGSANASIVAESAGSDAQEVARATYKKSLFSAQLPKMDWKKLFGNKNK